MRRNVVYAMQVSLDGVIEGPGRAIDWTDPDEELHAFFNEMERGAGASLYGRRLYELMACFWPTADEDPDAPPHVVEFARIWRETPKVAFSSTLERADWNARFARYRRT